MSGSGTVIDSMAPSAEFGLLNNYQSVRNLTEELCRPLQPEDTVIQSMPDASPTRWHLAHSTWFFETFVLLPSNLDYEVNPDFAYLFNSYYNLVGNQFPRHQRGLLSRPTLDEIWQYRSRVDQAMERLMTSDQCKDELATAITLGLHHEQQHQELILTDIKHLFSANPLYPCYLDKPLSSSGAEALPLQWRQWEGGIEVFGDASEGFAYDNEGPRHERLIYPFRIANRTITNGEYLEFVEDGGYQRPEFWLSDGWATIQQENWVHPLYWFQEDGQWFEFTLRGLGPLRHDCPVTHVSYYEAAAYAHWAGKRLPDEFEWELASHTSSDDGPFVQSQTFHPSPPDPNNEGTDPLRMLGNVWEWTQSPYAAYPGYRPENSALGEYNGKFMCNQYVLRGGSCVTSPDHIRRTYRNFFPPDARWQFTGIRLADDA